MRFLLDTHILVWWDSEPDRLSPAAMAAVSAADTTVYFSSASIWELAIKLSLKKLTLARPLAELIAVQSQNRLTELAVRSDHALAVETLPVLHKDPFDRLLVAQAIVDDLILVTADSHLAQYPVKTLW